MKIDKRHVEWLNLVQQDGLLVSALTLTEKKIYQRQDIVEQQLFREVAEESGFASLEDFQRVVKWPHAALREPTEERSCIFQTCLPRLHLPRFCVLETIHRCWQCFGVMKAWTHPPKMQNGWRRIR